eukprot:RCo002419
MAASGVALLPICALGSTEGPGSQVQFLLCLAQVLQTPKEKAPRLAGAAPVLTRGSLNPAPNFATIVLKSSDPSNSPPRSPPALPTSAGASAATAHVTAPNALRCRGG